MIPARLFKPGAADRLARIRLPMLASLAIVTAALPAAGNAAEPGAVGATVRSAWSLPAADMRKRAALLGAPSSSERTLLAQGYRAELGADPGRAPSLFLAASPEAARARAAFAGRDSAAAGGAPNVFGSIALSVAATPLDGQWRRASAPQALGQWRSAVRGDAPAGGAALVAQVNRWVNHKVAAVDDLPATGRADQWSGAAETLRRGRGDCEDFALAKMQLLASFGFADKDMYLVIARDLVSRADHAVLVVRLDGRFLVLDVANDEVLDARMVTDYRPIMSYSANRRWVHGVAYAAPAPQLRIAAAEPSPEIQVAAVAF